MINYALTFILPHIINHIYTALLGILFWCCFFIKKDKGDAGGKARMIYKAVIVLLLLRYLSEITMILPQNVDPTTSESSLYLLNIDQSVFVFVKIFITVFLVSLGIILLFIKNKLAIFEYLEKKKLIAFLFVYGISELTRIIDPSVEGIGYISAVLCLIALIPLSILTMNLVNTNRKNKLFFKLFTYNYVFSFFSITLYGIVSLMSFSQGVSEKLTVSEAFLNNEISYIDTTNYEEVSTLIDKAEGFLEVEIYHTHDPEVIITGTELYATRVISLDDGTDNSLVVGVTDKFMHDLVGIALRSWIIVVLIFNFVFSTTYYLYKSKSRTQDGPDN